MKAILKITITTAMICLASSCEKELSNSENPVDLGLSVKWASYNLGATSPEESGLYYQWADTKGYGPDIKDGKYFYISDKKWEHSSYKWFYVEKEYYGDYTRYNANPEEESADYLFSVMWEDDAACVALGENWRMPTDDEWRELLENCTFTWRRYKGVKGLLVRSKIPGYTDKCIFLPAAGKRYCDHLDSAGKIGYYWSSTLYQSPFYGGHDCSMAESFSFDGYVEDEPKMSHDNRSDGLSIRPVWPVGRRTAGAE